MTTWLAHVDAPGDGPTVAVKDAIDVQGLPTTVGCAAFLGAPPAEVDAECVAQIRSAGARIVGKTNLSELCWFAHGLNDVTGSPINPLDASRIPGGSSSGSAVAVAVGEVTVAIGTDTGGSVRVPAPVAESPASRRPAAGFPWPACSRWLAASTPSGPLPVT